MIKLISTILLLTVAQFSFSAEISEQKKRVIDEMLEISGALEVASVMGKVMADQMITMMSQQQKKLDPRVVEIVKDEVQKIMHEEFVANRFMHETFYRIYDKYFSTDELKAIVAFYRTPAGNKMARLLPSVSQEAAQAGRRHGESLGPVIRKRLEARFKKEGLM